MEILIKSYRADFGSPTFAAQKAKLESELAKLNEYLATKNAEVQIKTPDPKTNRIDILLIAYRVPDKVADYVEDYLKNVVF